MMKKFLIIFFLVISFSLNHSFIFAREFRSDVPIVLTQATYAKGYTGKIIKPLDAQTINKAVNDVFATYNTPAFESRLAPIFYDKNRLLDSIDKNVPKDARMRVLSVANTRNLGQSIEKDSHGNPVLVSHVSVVVRAQMEYNNSSGFQRRDGTNELELAITQPYKGQ